MATPGLGELSPFELKNSLIAYAKDYSQQKSATHKFLNAGRGNPNWIATTPREAFFLLGPFALDEAKRVWDEPGIGGMPHAEGITDRLRAYLADVPDSPGVQLLLSAISYATDELGFHADAFVHELVDSIIGDNYPEPDRMLHHCERVVARFIAKTMCNDRPPPGRFDLFAVEGGTAAMCYVFDSLFENRLLRRGDTIAIGTPIFTPYVELPHLASFGLKTIEIEQSALEDGYHSWQYPEEELAKLEDPRVKALFLVNPSNPASFVMDERTQARLVELVHTKRPDLIILTDDVYGTFVEGFRSIAADLPHNTILVYSYSKHFGCTGWRLGLIALHEDNVLDDKLAKLPESDKVALRARYAAMTPEPDGVKLIDRLVADSRMVALNHTAGLSLPQQAQMTLFSLYALLDDDDAYAERCREIVHERFDRLAKGLGIDFPQDVCRVGYYATFDLEAWGRAVVGDEFVDYLNAHHDPIEIVLALAQRRGTVLLNGSGFNGPAWSVRVSLANLDADEYEAIGRDLRDVLTIAFDRWSKRPT